MRVYVDVGAAHDDDDVLAGETVTLFEDRSDTQRGDRCPYWGGGRRKASSAGSCAPYCRWSTVWVCHTSRNHPPCATSAGHSHGVCGHLAINPAIVLNRLQQHGVRVGSAMAAFALEISQRRITLNQRADDPLLLPTSTTLYRPDHIPLSLLVVQRTSMPHIARPVQHGYGHRPQGPGSMLPILL
jgi:hypothetical protein